MHLSDCPYQMKVHHYSWTFSAELNSFHYYFQSDWTVSKFIKARKQELKMSCAYTKIPQLNSFVKPVKQSLSQTEKNNSSRARNRPQRLHIIKVHSLVTFIWSCKDLVISEAARLPSVWDGVVLHFWMGSPLPEPLGEAQSQATEVSTGEPSLGHLWPGRNCAPILHHLTHEKWSHYLPVPSFTYTRKLSHDLAASTLPTCMHHGPGFLLQPLARVSTSSLSPYHFQQCIPESHGGTSLKYRFYLGRLVAGP